MSNYCITHHKFYGPAIDVEKFYNFIQEARNKKKAAGEDDNWLGILVEACNINPGMINCRGFISDCCFGKTSEHSYVDFYVDDAWIPHNKPFDLVLHHLGLTDTVIHEWIAEEAGCDLFQKSSGNVYLIDEYSLEIQSEEFRLEIMKNFASESEVINFLNTLPKEVLKVCQVNEIESITDCYAVIEGLNEFDAFCALHKFEEV